MTFPDQASPGAVSRREFLSRSLTLAATTAVTGASLAQVSADRPKGNGGRIMAYVGTYSFGTHFSNGQGIHLFEMDPATGVLSSRGVLRDNSSPSCLAFNPSRTCLYAINRGLGTPGERSGAVSAFAIDRSDGHLTFLNIVSSEGAVPGHLSVHPSGKYVLVANYVGGSVAVLPIRADGGLGPAIDFRRSRGVPGHLRASSAPPGSFAISGHDAPHFHMIQADRAGRFVVATDLGLDRIFIWGFDERTGKLSPVPVETVFPSGDGPRHFAFHPNGRWFYSLQEEASTLAYFAYDPSAGRLTARQTVSSLPPGFAGSSFASEIMISPDGKFVYAANRLHDSIASFAVGPDGRLSFVGEEWSRGDYTPSFNFDPSGNFLFVCNQRSDSLATFRADRSSGGLAFTGQYTPVGSPSAILFLELGPG